MTSKDKLNTVEAKKLKIICCGRWKTASKSCSGALRILGYNPCDYMQSMSEFSQVWLDFINGKVPIESVLDEIGKSGYDCTQDVPWSLYWKELFEANGPDTKVILTVRDSTEKWWTSFLKFFTQEIMRADLWGFNTTNLMVNLCKTGLAGSAMKRMMELDYIVTCRFYHESFYTKTFSTEKVLKAIESAKETVCKRYEEHNELVKKTIPKENLLVWNLKEGWEPLCKFLNVPIPDVPVPCENVTGDLGWGKEYSRGFSERSE